MASSSVCGLRRVLRYPPTCLSFSSIFARNEHVASSEGSISSDSAAKRSAKSGTVGQEDKRAEEDLAPDPITGYYDQATEAQENALKRKK